MRRQLHHHRNRFCRWLNIAKILIGLVLPATVQATPGSLRWPGVTLATTSDIHSSPAISPDGSTVYVGSPDGKLYALSTATGAQLWSFNTSGGIVGSPVVARSGARIYVVTTSGYLYAVNSDGSNGFSAPGNFRLTTSAINSTPALNFTEDYLYVKADTKLYALYVAASTPPTGPAWTVTLGLDPTPNTFEPLAPSPAIGADGTIYATGIAGFSDQIFAVSASGTLKWGPVSMTDYTGMSSVSIGPDGTVFIGGEDNHVTGYSPLDGSLLTTCTAGIALSSEINSTPVISSGGNLYFGSEDGNVYAFKPDGTALWSTPFLTAGIVAGSGALTADGRLWITSQDGRLYCLDASTGASLISTGSPATPGIAIGAYALNASSPAIGPDGYVYVAAGRKLFAVEGFGSASAQASGFWPGFRNNARHAADVRFNRWTESAVTSVTIVPVGPFASGTTSLASGVNDVDTVTGYANGYPNYPASGPNITAAFAYSPLRIAGPAALATTASYGSAVVTSGKIAGYWQPNGYSTSFGFFYDPTVSPATTTTLNPFTGFANSAGQALSPDATKIVGRSYGSGSGNLATKWVLPSGTAVSLGTLTPGGDSYAYGVNSSGQVIGKSYNGSVVHGFVSAFSLGIQGAADDIGSQAGSTGDSAAYAINGFNEVVGTTKITGTPVKRRPFLKVGSKAGNGSSGTWRLPAMPVALNGDDGTAYGLNERGQVVGTANTGLGSTAYRAFLWTPDSQLFGLKDLNAFLSAAQQSQWTLLCAYGINDAGRIVGYGTYNGQPTAFLLYPN